MGKDIKLKSANNNFNYCKGRITGCLAIIDLIENGKNKLSCYREIFLHMKNKLNT